MINSKGDSPNKVKIVYKYDPEHRIFSATDVYGGMNPKSRLVMNFFTDIHSNPIIETNTLKDTKIDPKIPPTILYEGMGEDDNEDKTVFFNRIIHDTVILNPDSALEVAYWMIDTVLSDPKVRFNRKEIKKHFNNMVDKYLMDEEKK